MDAAKELIKDFLELTFNDHYTIWTSANCELHFCVVDNPNDDMLPLRFQILMALLDKKFHWDNITKMFVYDNELTFEDDCGHEIVLAAIDNEVHHMNLVD